MKRSRLQLLFLLVLCVSAATWLEPWFQTWSGNRAGSANVLQVALGDGRRLFARHVYAKADAYFHNGYYPSIFDRPQGMQKAHLTHETGHTESGEEEEDHAFMGPPRDWIDAFSRHFYPSRHTHLGEAACEDEHEHAHAHEHGEDCDHDGDTAGGAQGEVLPWLRLSVGLDPQRVETYVVGAYWLRRELKKPLEAEQFLREGLRDNPGNHELLFELGRIYAEDKKDPGMARNYWELALKDWRDKEGPKEEPNIFLHAQILGNLAKLEEEQGRYSAAIGYLQTLKTFSPHAEQIQKWIEELAAKSPAP
jgi:tetratricopeptide (TPR) repeat protein